MDNSLIIKGLVALIFAGLVSFATTPPVGVLAHKLGAIDVPKDNRRMHSHPIPRMGGLAIYIGFVISMLFFCNLTKVHWGILAGGTIVVITGIIDDIYTIPALAKLGAQIVAALAALAFGVRIDWINLFGHYVMFGPWAYPITVLWIVGLTNAVNLIDGLDGLACGVSAIGGFSLLLVTIVLVDPSSTLLAAIFAGSCLGFIPFNTNPAKIFMGDTGAMFLGFTLSVMSIQGVFKLHAVLSFIVPFLIFGLPIFDSVFAALRRILTGRSPFSPDRGHIHHRLIDLGLNQKQSVRVLYAVSGMLGISAVMMTSEHLGVSILIITTGIIIGIVNWTIFKKEAARAQSGLFPNQSAEAEEKNGEDEVKDEKN